MVLFPDADDHYTTDLMNVLDKYVNSNYDIIYFACDHIIERPWNIVITLSLYK